MKATPVWAIAAALLLVALSYWVFPGHSYLLSDTQIYVPLFEHLRDPEILKNDLLSQASHVAMTIYDEVTVALAAVTGGGVESALILQQWIFRAAAVLGVMGIAMSAGFPLPVAILAAAAMMLGATIAGPAVLLVEYEPVPRAFALGLLWAALGLFGHGMLIRAGLCVTLAFLLHAPTTLPVLAVLLLWTLFGKREIAIRNLWPWLILAVGVAVLMLFSAWQPAMNESQPLFSFIDPQWEQLQKIRASYVWPSLWPTYFLWQYAALCPIAVLAVWRIRQPLPPVLRWFLVWLPIAGVLSLPVAWLVTEQWKWSLLPQIQPARAVLWVIAVLAVAGVLAAANSVSRRRWWECLLWLLLVYSLPVQMRLMDLILRFGSDSQIRAKVAAIAICAVASTAALWFGQRKPKGAALPVLAALLPFFLLPPLAGVEKPVSPVTPELAGLAAWAETNTQPGDMFLFPTAGKQLDPGVFRALARRPVFVDWKSGGQVNFLREFSSIWWDRWSEFLEPGTLLDDWSRYEEAGIDLLVLKPGDVKGGNPIFRNSRYEVYEVSGVNTQ